MRNANFNPTQKERLLIEHETPGGQQEAQGTKQRAVGHGRRVAAPQVAGQRTKKRNGRRIQGFRGTYRIEVQSTRLSYRTVSLSGDSATGSGLIVDCTRIENLN